MNRRIYRYIGPEQIAERICPDQIGFPIRAAQDVLRWVQDTRQELSAGCVVATFVVDASGLLLVADRHSEHLACAGGQPVRSAGEIVFVVQPVVRVVEVSNQSTGYCPEPESWPAVAEALAQAGLTAPDSFSLACEFRRCIWCAGINLVKDGIFECALCGAELPARYNIQNDHS